MTGLTAALAVGVLVALVWLMLAAKLVRDDEQRKEEVEARRREIDREREARRLRRHTAVEVERSLAAKIVGPGEEKADAVDAPESAPGESDEAAAPPDEETAPAAEKREDA